MSIFDLSGIQSQTGLKHIEFHPVLESTNSLAMELVSDLVPHRPALVLTESQTAGRGRGAHQWFSAAGALTFSLVLNAMPIPASRRSLISIATGVAVSEALEQQAVVFGQQETDVGLKSRGRNFKVKWPNDILVDDRKLCGILTELNTDGGQATVVIGVGVNVNNSLASLPEEVQTAATSLYDLWGQSLDLSGLLIKLINSISKSCDRLVTDHAAVIDELNQRNALKGRQVSVDVAGQLVNGMCEGIDQDGCLLLMTTSGLRRIVAGSIVSWSS